MIRFTIGGGYDAYLSEQDAHLVDGTFCWRAMERPGGKVYVQRSVRLGPMDWTVELLHRVVADPPAGGVVEFVDGNPLNCTRENLRVVTTSDVRRRAWLKRKLKARIVPQ